MSVALTPQAIAKICSETGKPPADAPKPIVQVINVKSMANASGGTRYRLVLSDGTHFVTAMLASQFMGDTITEHCIIRMTDHMVNVVNSRSVVILMDFSVLDATLTERIGEPTDIEKSDVPTVAKASGAAAAGLTNTNQPLYNKTNAHQQQQAQSAAAAKQHQPMNNTYGAAASNTTYGSSGPPRASPRGTSAANPYDRPSPTSSSFGHQPVVRSANVASAFTPIAALNMYNNRWTIQARLTLKSDIRTWSNAKGEGSLFSIELLDSTMDVRATFFKEAVDKFYHMLEVGKVYSFSGGRLKVANMQYNNCKSQYEITFDQNSEIHLQNDDGGISKQTYDFVKIAQVEHVDEKKMVDVLAIVKAVGEPANLVSKKSGQELTKCDLTLVDDSGVEINLTVWGEKAKTAERDFAGQPVVAFRKARVSDYGGKSLSSGPVTEANPDVPEAQALSAWWAAGGAASTRSLSTSGGGGKMDSLADRKTIAAIKDETMGMGEKPDWLSFKATLTFLKKDKEGGAWYPACANAGEPCKNRYKCTLTTDNQWHCDKCQGTYPNPVRRWIFSGVIEDATSTTWVSFFNEQAESLLGGLTADEGFALAYPNGGNSGIDQDAYDSFFARALFTEWIFKCKVKNEFHNDEARVKTSVYSLHPVDYLKESVDMLAALELM